MGYGFRRPSARRWGIRQDRLDIAGDGSIQMCIQGDGDSSDPQAAVKIVILNNGYWAGAAVAGPVLRQALQRRGTSPATRELRELAEAYGGAGFLVTDKADVPPTLERAMEITDRPCIVDLRTPPEENVFRDSRREDIPGHDGEDAPGGSLM